MKIVKFRLIYMISKNVLRGTHIKYSVFMFVQDRMYEIFHQKMVMIHKYSSKPRSFWKVQNPLGQIHILIFLNTNKMKMKSD
jgi:hypothetical protein